MTLITCQNAAFSYDGNLAVNALNFQVQKGNYLCIVGESGSGKSTLMQGVLQLKKTQNGRCQFCDGLRLSDIGYLPQQTSLQKNFPASAYEVILSGRLGAKGLLPFYSSNDKRVVASFIKKLGIDNLKNRCYRELSGGEKQRVLLARALSAARRLLLLDEPTAGLDPLVTGEIYTLIKEANTAGLTIIMVSHDIEQAVKYASHILHLKNEQVFFGSTKDYLQSEIGKAFIGGNKHD